jgi:hypothetical protein
VYKIDKDVVYWLVVYLMSVYKEAVGSWQLGDGYVSFTSYKAVYSDSLLELSMNLSTD